MWTFRTKSRARSSEGFSLNRRGQLVTMRRYAIRDDQWKRIEPLLPGKPGDPGQTAKDNRLFIDAVLWIGRTGAPWRDLP